MAGQVKTYLALQDGYLNNQGYVEAGTVFEWDGPKGSWMQEVERGHPDQRPAPKIYEGASTFGGVQANTQAQAPAGVQAAPHNAVNPVQPQTDSVSAAIQQQIAIENATGQAGAEHVGATGQNEEPLRAENDPALNPLGAQ